jgi:uncharacterized protein (DUF362 family)
MRASTLPTVASVLFLAVLGACQDPVRVEKKEQGIGTVASTPASSAGADPHDAKHLALEGSTSDPGLGAPALSEGTKNDAPSPVDGLSGASMLLSAEGALPKKDAAGGVRRLDDADEPVFVVREIDVERAAFELMGRLKPELTSETPVLLLPNVGGLTWFSSDADDGLRGRITDPRFVRGVIEYLRAAHVKKITLGVSWAVGKPRAVEEMLRLSGYQALADEYPEVHLLDLFYYGGSEPGDVQTKLVPVPTPHAAQLEEKLFTAQVVALHQKSGLIINIPKFKTHRFAVITAGIKNLMGLVNLAEAHPKSDAPAPNSKWKMHRELGAILKATSKRDEWSPKELSDYQRAGWMFSRRIADVYEALRPDFTLVDGVIATDGDGFDSIGSVPLSVAVGSRNAAYADVVVAQMAGLFDSGELKSAIGTERPLGVSEVLRRFYDVGKLPKIIDPEASEFSSQFSSSGAGLTLELMNKRTLKGSARQQLAGTKIRVGTQKQLPKLAELKQDWPLKETKWLTRDWAGERLPPGLTTGIYVAKSATHFLVAMRAETLHRDVRPHDGPKNSGDTEALYKWDNFEFFFDPTPETPSEYYEIEVSREGEFLDLHIESGPGKVDVSWNSNAAIEVLEEGGVWFATLVLPLDKFADKTRLSANFFRTERYGKERIYAAWQPTLTPKPNFHVPERFGLLEL